MRAMAINVTPSAVQQTATAPSNDGVSVLTAEFETFYARVYRYLLHRFFDPELAEELTAQTFYKAAGGLRRVGADSARIQAWLLRTATNLANTHYRRNRLRRLFLLQSAKLPPTVTEDEAFADSNNGRRLAHVRAVLLALRPTYQTVIVLRFYTRMSLDEIAAVLGCRPNTARARLSRALKEMRERLGSAQLLDSTKS